MSSTISFQSYVSPGPNIAYSDDYFATLTFEDTVHLENTYPKVLPRGSIIGWTFDDSHVETPQASTITSYELIPHYDDVRDIIHQMPQAYARSARSVSLKLSIPGDQSPRMVFYHFSKV